MKTSLRVMSATAVLVTFAGADRADAQTAGYFVDDARTLSQALHLGGPLLAALPISLTETPPAGTSSGVEAWTSWGEDGRPRKIFLYTQSNVFRCANRHPTPVWQCRLKLASILVHEAVHLSGNRDERKAYETQIAFLVRSGASSQLITSVARARDYVIANESAARHAIARSASTSSK